MNDPVLAQALAVLDTADVAVSDDAGCTDLLGAIRRPRRVDAVREHPRRSTRQLRDHPHKRTAAA